MSSPSQRQTTFTRFDLQKTESEFKTKWLKIIGLLWDMGQNMFCTRRNMAIKRSPLFKGNENHHTQILESKCKMSLISLRIVPLSASPGLSVAVKESVGWHGKSKSMVFVKLVCWSASHKASNKTNVRVGNAWSQAGHLPSLFSQFLCLMLEHGCTSVLPRIS